MQSSRLISFIVAVAAVALLGVGPSCGGDATSPDSGASPDGGPDGGQGTEGVRHGAHALPGGLDRIVISKSVADPGACTVVRLVHPAGDNQLAITTPQAWSIEAAYQTQGAACPGAADIGSVPQDAVQASSGQGAVTWADPDSTLYPGVLSIDVDLEFVTSGVTSREVLRASDIAVTQ